jgi:microsomal prostaglandin-E synthase 2
MMRRLGLVGGVGAAHLSLNKGKGRIGMRPASVSCSASACTKEVEQQIVVYQYKICPFCSKVKTYLDFLKQPYETVEVNPLTKGEISFSKEYRKVPIMIRLGTQINDSDAIIQYITKELKSKEKLGNRFFPSDTEKWAEWSDKRLAVMLYPNITRTMDESWECFGYVDKVQSWNPAYLFATRFAGTVAMSLANGKIKKKYNIVDERGELKTTLAEWTNAVGSKKFLHGDFVTLPDLMVFGVLRSIAGLTTFHEVMEGNSVLSAWYSRMDSQIPSMAKPR